MHLTNYSINRKNTKFDRSETGSKWYEEESPRIQLVRALSSLFIYLKNQGVETEKIIKDIEDLVIKTIICGEKGISAAMDMYVPYKYSLSGFLFIPSDPIALNYLDSTFSWIQITNLG